MPRLAWVVFGKLLTEQHSIMTLSSTIRRDGVDVSLIYTNSPKTVLSEIRRLKPDMVAYSLMFGSHRRYIPVSRSIRKEFPGLTQVAGGPYTTYFPESINELSLDAVCIGEGDASLTAFIRASSEGTSAVDRIEGFHIRHGNGIKTSGVGNLVNDLDSLPFPDRALFYEQDSLLRNQELSRFLQAGDARTCVTTASIISSTRCTRARATSYARALIILREICEVKKKYGFQYLSLKTTSLR